MNQPAETQKTFGFNRANVKVILYSLPVFILAGLFFIISGMGRHNPRDAAAFILGGAILLMISAGLFVSTLLMKRIKASLTPNDLTVTNMFGQVSQCKLNDISEIYELITYHQRGFANNWVYTVQCKNGQRLKLTKSVEKVQSLGYLLQKAVFEGLLLQAQTVYKNGETVNFGPQIGINPQGVFCAGQSLPWEQVGEITINHTGDVRIQQLNRRTAWKTIMHARIANFPVLRQMLQKATEQYPININDPTAERVRQSVQTPK